MFAFQFNKYGQDALQHIKLTYIIINEYFEVIYAAIADIGKQNMLFRLFD